MNDQPTTKWIGQPLDRVDGPAKVTGAATYSADYRGDQQAAIGFIVEATIGSGKVSQIETADAEAADGVHLVMTHQNAPEQAPFGDNADAGRFGMSHAVLQNDEVRYYGAPVAFIVADTLEQARYAAGLIKVTYQADDSVFDAFEHEEDAFAPDSLDGAEEADVDKGDFDAIFAESAETLDATFHTAAQHAAAMEPHATVAEWDGDKLTVHIAVQILSSARKAFANTLKIDPANVRIVTPFVGGGFGSKLGVHSEGVLAALAARKLQRPVRIAQTRRHVFSNGPHRTNHRQRIRLGASADGKLLSVAHETLGAMSRDYPFAEAAASPTMASYAAEAMKIRHRVVAANIPHVDSMRAPGEAIGTLTYESAIDELAVQCGIDPLEFRLKNEPKQEPASGKEFSTRTLARCLREGAELFGWEKGPVEPGALREGRLLIGRGLAAAIRPNMMQPAEAAAELDRDGRLTVELDMTDIGTGTYTILTQIAAETLGLDPDAIAVRLGDTNYPKTCGSGGSFGAGSTGTAVSKACASIRDTIIERAARLDSDWAGVNSGDLRIENGNAVVAGRSLALGAILDAIGGDSFKGKGQVEPGKAHEDLAQYSYGGVFAEVSVNADTGEIRVRRLAGAFDAGRILNEKTARSQLMGGMIFGLGAALMEESLMDMRFGSFMNRDLAEYHIAVNRDVPRLEVKMLDTFDQASNPLGSKGIGELGICGTGPAIANAVYAATGYRTRKFPIHLEDLLDHLPAL